MQGSRRDHPSVLHPREPAPGTEACLEAVGGLHLVIETLLPGRSGCRRGSARGAASGRPGPHGCAVAQASAGSARARTHRDGSPRAAPYEGATRSETGPSPSQVSQKRDQKNLAPAAKDWREAAYSLGILKTGLLEKPRLNSGIGIQPQMSSVKKTRFVVLTHAQLSMVQAQSGRYGVRRRAGRDTPGPGHVSKTRR